jgi:hypothetical protein
MMMMMMMMMERKMMMKRTVMITTMIWRMSRIRWKLTSKQRGHQKHLLLIFSRHEVVHFVKLLGLKWGPTSAYF